MKKISLLFVLVTFVVFAQEKTVFAELYVKQRRSELLTSAEKRASDRIREKLYLSLVKVVQKRMKLPKSELLSFFRRDKELRIRFLKQEWAKTRFFLMAELHYNELKLYNDMRDYFKTLKENSDFDKTKLRYSIADIIKYRNAFMKQRKENTDSLLQILKLGMSRQDVLRSFLYLSERKIALDLKSLRREEGGKILVYLLKNTYLSLKFSAESLLLTEIVNFSK